MSSELDRLRDALGDYPNSPTSRPHRERMVAAAKQMLDAYSASKLPLQLAEPAHFGDKPIDQTTGENFDNPMIHSGALLAALSYSCQVVRSAGIQKAQAREPYEAEKRNLLAINSGISGILARLESLNHTGYVTRWRQASTTSRIEGDWQAEPSLDEYSGLLMGLAWANKYIPDPLTMTSCWYNDLHARIDSMLIFLNDYLRRWEGWLIHPGGDLTVRGPQFVGNAYPVRRFLEEWRAARVSKGTSFPGATFSNKHPLQATQKLRFLLKNSHQWIGRHWNDATYKDCIEAYKKTLKPFDGILLGISVVDALFAVFPFGIGLPLEAIELLLISVTDEQVWSAFAHGLGLNADRDGYNAQIFDRMSLACCDMGDVRSHWAPRAERDIEADRQGWQCLTEACRVYFGAKFNAEEVLEVLGRNADAFMAGTPVTCIENGEGFVLAWAILCSALQIDPGISWDKVFTPDTFPLPPGFDPNELDAFVPPPSPPAPTFPALRFSEFSLEVEDSEPEGIFPVVCCIPIVVAGGASVPFKVDRLLEPDISYLTRHEVEGLRSGETLSMRCGDFVLKEGDLEGNLYYIVIICVWDVRPTTTEHSDKEGAYLEFSYEGDPRDWIQSQLNGQFSRAMADARYGSFQELSEAVRRRWDDICQNFSKAQSYISCADVALTPDGRCIAVTWQGAWTSGGPSFDLPVSHVEYPLSVRLRGKLERGRFPK